MITESQVTVAGNLTADPQVKFGKTDGTPFAVFTVAQNLTRFDRASGQWVQTGTNFVDVIAFRALGINVAESARKGDPVVVHGRLRIKNWSNGERSGTNVQLDAQAVGFDMSFGQGTFARVKRPVVPGGDRMDSPDVQVAVDELRGANGSGGFPGADDEGLPAASHHDGEAPAYAGPLVVDRGPEEEPERAIA